MILANSLFIASKWGIDIRDVETGAALNDGSSLIKNNIYQVSDAAKQVMASNNSFATVDLLKTYLTSKNNTFIDATAAGALLTTPYSQTAPNFTIKAGSAAATGATF
ncbi:hypothetical protein D3C87_1728410 [compost metagenome]